MFTEVLCGLGNEERVFLTQKRSLEFADSAKKSCSSPRIG